jgi:putative DNA primase/helicase
MSGLEPSGEVIDVVEVDPEDAPDPDVAEGLERARDGHPLGTLANVVRVLDEDPRWTDRIRWSEFSLTPCLDGRELTDAGLIDVELWLDRVYALRPGVDKLQRAVSKVADRHAFHPVRDWITAQRWDGVPRIDRFLSTYCGAEDVPVVREIARRWFVGAVARVFQPGCKLDTMPVLAGPQGARKSTAFRQLMPDEAWFTDTGLPVGTKDAMLQLAGVWLVEVAELSGLQGVTVEAVKAFLSSARDRFRRPYGRTVETHPRQCVLVGTTNEGEFLVDPTGSRRYWPVRVGRIDFDAIAGDREQLWAEAWAAWRKGEPWWFDEAGEARLRAYQTAFEEGDPWESAIALWVRRRDGAFTVEQVLGEALGVPIERMDRGKRTRVGRILAGLGCVQRRVGTSTRLRVWERPGQSDAGDSAA